MAIHKPRKSWICFPIGFGLGVFIVPLFMLMINGSPFPCTFRMIEARSVDKSFIAKTVQVIFPIVQACGGGAGSGGGPPPSQPECPQKHPQYMQRDPMIEGHGLCRHACGINCATNDCQVLQPPGVVTCVNNSTGSSHRSCTYALVRCGSNDACATHDDCYDRSYYEIDPIGYRRQCDIDCTVVYKSLCYDWWDGNNYQAGPNPITIDYTYPPTAGPVQDGPCP